MQEDNPPNITDTLTRLTESLKQNGLHPKALQTYSVIPLEEAEVEAEEEGHKEGGSKGTPKLPTIPVEEEVKEVSEENPEEENLTEVL